MCERGEALKDKSIDLVFRDIKSQISSWEIQTPNLQISAHEKERGLYELPVLLTNPLSSDPTQFLALKTSMVDGFKLLHWAVTSSIL